MKPSPISSCGSKPRRPSHGLFGAGRYSVDLLERLPCNHRGHWRIALVKLQLKAASTAFVLFLGASLALFGLVRGVGNVAAVLPLPRSLPSYSPLQTIGALLDLKPLI